jgi:multidrug efflux pump subunit AcrB
MWIVRLALNRPYTFIVLALLILMLSPAVILRTPTDIFPNINIPVISVAWTYTGLNPEDIETRLTTPYEKVLTTLVDNIQHIESTSYNGVSVVKIYLQPGTSLDTANAQVVAAAGLYSDFFLRPSSRRRSSISARRAFPLCNLGSPEKECQSRNSTTRDSTFFGLS